MSAAGRLEVLTDNDARLKKLLAGATLRNAMLKDTNAKSGDARREAAVTLLCSSFEVKPAAGECLHRRGSNVRTLSERGVRRCCHSRKVA